MSQTRRSVRAWVLYDWANSAFATTVMAVVLPVYYSRVAGATLDSPAQATAYWSMGLSASLLIAAVLSPLLGTYSDVARRKKKLLALFAALGVLSTALLYLVERGDWVLASVLVMLGRIGFSSANVFYDALLPHVAAPEERDRISSRGYALGYLGGGLLLAANAAMIAAIPGTLGPRLSFVTVAIWWATFSLPLLLWVPEPPTEAGRPGRLFADTVARLWSTFREVRTYRDLFLLLLAFLVYNDGIGTIIGLAAIYGAELGIADDTLILALLLVQFVGVPYSLLFGRLPAQQGGGSPRLLAFVVFSALALPACSFAALHLVPATRQEQALTIAAVIGAAVASGALSALLVGRPLFGRIASRLRAREGVLVALCVYALAAACAFFLDSALEFWVLAWMIAMVQGGSQALSRSLYAQLTPPRLSGEFFGLFGVMEKLSAVVGPLLFAAAAASFESSRPAVLSLLLFFALGGWLLSRVDVERGQAAARLAQPSSETELPA